MLKHDAVFYQV